MSESNQIALSEHQHQTNQMMSVIERVATSPDADIEKLERLLDMQERVLNRNAEQAFNSSLAIMQGELPTVAETAKGHNTTYAPLEGINRAVRPTLQKYGFAVTFRTKQTEKAVEIVAVLSHKDGHSQETSLVLPHDSSGNKNAVQAIGSTISYGKRYALCALLNISTGDDTDGQPAYEKISGNETDMLYKAMAVAGVSSEEFCSKSGTNSVSDLPKDRFQRAMNWLKSKATEDNA